MISRFRINKEIKYQTVIPFQQLCFTLIKKNLENKNFPRSLLKLVFDELNPLLKNQINRYNKIKQIIIKKNQNKEI